MAREQLRTVRTPRDLGDLLRAMRRRIDPETRMLGSHPRLPSRCGRPVTQDELAEAVGVSLRWYGMLESGAAVRASTRLMLRIAEVLMLAESERSLLFRLALPELPESRLAPDSLELWEAMQALRSAARRVWSASSEIEVMTVLTEILADRFSDHEMLGTFQRAAPGLWAFPVTLGDSRLQRRVQNLLADIAADLTVDDIDQIMLHDVLTEPGQVGTSRELYDGLPSAPAVQAGFERAGFGSAEYLDAHVRSNRGFRSTIFVAYLTSSRPFSDLDRAVVGMLTDVGSLALSDAPS